MEMISHLEADMGKGMLKNQTDFISTLHSFIRTGHKLFCIIGKGHLLSTKGCYQCNK